MNNTEIVSAYLDQLAEELKEPEIPPGAITVRMLMDKTGRPENTCRALLDRKVRDGKMGVVRVKISNYYFPL